MSEINFVRATKRTLSDEMARDTSFQPSPTNAELQRVHDRPKNIPKKISSLSRWPSYAEKRVQRQGFPNRGNFCYRNSVIQALLHVPALLNSVLQNHRHCRPRQTCAICRFRMLCMTYYSPQHGIRQVIQSLSHFEVGLRQSQAFRLGRKWYWEQQNDADEFCSRVLDAFRESDGFNASKALNTEIDSSHDLVRSVTALSKQETRCKRCGLTYSPPDASLSAIPLALGTGNSVQDLLSNFFEDTPPENWACDRCSEKGRKKHECSMSRKLKRNPIVLIITLKRYEMRGRKASKISTLLKYNDPLDISKVSWEQSSTQYRLCAIVLHRGSRVNSGHYICIAKAPPGDDQWTRYDDTHISEQTIEEAISNDGRLTPYLLFYERVAL